MSGEEDRQDADAELEREIRQARKFNPQEALGRMAGPGAMKGASAVPPQQQAENAVASWLGDHLADPVGALRVVLYQQLKGSALLLANMDQPQVAIGRHCERVLGSDDLLKELVRQADVEWGRMMDERPHFEREGSVADADDPYTIASVRNSLLQVVAQVA